MAEVKFSSFAENDLEDIFYYFAQFNIETGRKFLKELMLKFKLLAENPKIGRTYEEFFVGLRSFPYKDYVIFYFAFDNGVEIYRVLHGARDIETLFEDFIEGLEP